MIISAVIEKLHLPTDLQTVEEKLAEEAPTTSHGRYFRDDLIDFPAVHSVVFRSCSANLM
jgi:hypothetical protein